MGTMPARKSSLHDRRPRLILPLLLAASAAWAGAGPAGLADLREGRTVSGFTAKALYLNAEDRPMGARFVHRNGMAVDVLFFASVPQVSVYAGTLPLDEKGESHTGEHLLLGKGAAGKYLNSLMDLRLAEYTAGTYTDLTEYQFHTAAGPQGFFELLEAFLKALLHPDFTDEEIRREVAHLEALPDPAGRLHLEEKGTVYNEMVSTMEKAEDNNWYQLTPMLFGQGHPLARNQGGLPAAIRELTPEEIRRYHDANYHLGPNMKLIAALPLKWRAEDFLKRLDALFERLEPGGTARTYAESPAPRPLAAPEIRIGSFPSDDPNVPQSAYVAWKPPADLSEADLIRISLLLNLLAGSETSYLYRDLVDRKTRKFDSGLTGVSGSIDDPPMAFPLVSLDGLPAASVVPGKLERLRGAVTGRVQWLAGLKAGDPELREAAEKARSLISSSRRAMLKFMDDPPRFGDRLQGIAWHRRLDMLGSEPGFRKSIPQTETFDRLLGALDAGKNPWADIARRAGMLETPYVSAVRPDAERLRREKEEKAARLAAEESRLAERLGKGDAQAALAAFKAGYDAKSGELEARDRSIAKPGFIQDPPLALDDVDFTTGAIGGRPLTETFFGSTPFTDLSLHFDLTGVPEKDLDLLPLLASALTDAGVQTRTGETLDYVKARERWRSEIYGLGADVGDNPRTGRHELTLSASASSPAEIDKAAEWLENYLVRPQILVSTDDAAVASRLIDLIHRDVKGLSDIFQQAEETWAAEAADAYVYQDQPVYTAVRSPFTARRYLSRLRWRLDDSSAPRRKAMISALAELETTLTPADRPSAEPRPGSSRAPDADSADGPKAFGEASKRVAALGGELAEYLGFEVSHLPPDHWREDALALVRETRADLSAPRAETVERLKALLRRVLAPGAVRIHVMGNPADAERAVKRLEALLSRLPGKAPGGAGPAPRRPLVLRRLRERYPDLTGTPVHVALVNNGTKTGVHVVSAAGPDYRSPDRDAALDALAAGIFSGGGPQSFFMQTWSAGLAYSNGLRANPSKGRIRYYAERCPDLVQTMKFVVGLASATSLDDGFLIQYSLSNAFADYRGAGDFSSRGAALADDLADGLTPETVRRFKRTLVDVSQEPGILAAVGRRLPSAVGRVLTGYGIKVSSSPGAVGFAIGPDEILAKYEAYLKEQGEAGRLLRLYPRDFWPDPDAPR